LHNSKEMVLTNFNRHVRFTMLITIITYDILAFPYISLLLT